jgi:hypothetical protein
LVAVVVVPMVVTLTMQANNQPYKAQDLHFIQQVELAVQEEETLLAVLMVRLEVVILLLEDHQAKVTYQLQIQHKVLMVVMQTNQLQEAVVAELQAKEDQVVQVVNQIF